MDGPKVSYVFTLHHNSARLTPEIMASINMHVNEITMTRDNAFMYVYIHLQRQTRKAELERAMKDLVSHGVTGTNIFGYNEIDGNSRGSYEFLEDHPGFRTLVQHQADGNTNFHRWTAEDYADANSGFNKLKKKLLSRRASGQAAGGSGGGASTGGMGGRASSDEEEEEPRPGNDERGKRKRPASPDSGGMRTSDIFDFMRTAYENTRQDALAAKDRELALQSRLASEAVAKVQLETKAKVDGVDKMIEDLKKEAKDEQALQIETASKKLVEEMQKKDDEHKLVLDNVNNEHTEEMKTKDDEHKLVLDNVNKEHAEEMKTKDDEHKLVLDNVNKEHAEEMKTKDEENQRFFQEMKAGADMEINRLRARLDEFHALTKGKYERMVHCFMFAYRGPMIDRTLMTNKLQKVEVGELCEDINLKYCCMHLFNAFKMRESFIPNIISEYNRLADAGGRVKLVSINRMPEVICGINVFGNPIEVKMRQDRMTKPDGYYSWTNIRNPTTSAR